MECPEEGCGRDLSWTVIASGAGLDTSSGKSACGRAGRFWSEAKVPTKDGIVLGAKAGLCPAKALLVESMGVGTDNVGDGGYELCPMEGLSTTADAGVLAESAGLGDREPQAETVRQTTAEGVAMPC